MGLFGDVIEVFVRLPAALVAEARLPGPLAVDVRLPAGPINDWLLLTGIWNDGGRWLDFETWRD